MVGRVALGGFVVAQVGFVGMMGVGSAVEHIPDAGPMIWSVTAYIWHLFVLPGSVVVWGIVQVYRCVRRKGIATAMQSSPELKTGVTRREALAAVSAALPPLIATGVGVVAVQRLGHFRVREMELAVPGLPADLDGLSIAQVSDLHIGRFLPKGTAERVAEAANALAADLVVFTGDLLDVSCEAIAPGIDFIRRLDRRHGLAVIEGNHDGMKGCERFEKEMKGAGLPLLLDESIVFKVPGRATPVQFLGLTWGELLRGWQTGRRWREAQRWYRVDSAEAMADSMKKLVGQRQREAFPILLAHHPHTFDLAAAAGLPLVLSGHTHGGQLMLTEHIGAGPIRFKYWTGVYDKPGSRLFVNNGVGNWFPLRINAPAEIVKLTLRGNV
jgi:predicted MPP superfamily phosphohydrolase